MRTNEKHINFKRLEQLCPTEIANQTKNYVTLSSMAAYWITLLMKAAHWIVCFQLSKLNLLWANVLKSFDLNCKGNDCLALLATA